MMRELTLAVLAASLAACATPNDPKDASQTRVVCEDAMPTGSVLRKQMCWTEEARATHQDEVQSLRRKQDSYRPPAPDRTGGR